MKAWCICVVHASVCTCILKVCVLNTVFYRWLWAISPNLQFWRTKINWSDFETRRSRSWPDQMWWIKVGVICISGAHQVLSASLLTAAMRCCFVVGVYISWCICFVYAGDTPAEEHLAVFSGFRYNTDKLITTTNLSKLYQSHVSTDAKCKLQIE